MITHNGRHDYWVPCSRGEPLHLKLSRSPWQYDQGAQSYLVPGFALAALGLRHTDAVDVSTGYKPRPFDTFDLCALPLEQPLWKFQAEDVLKLCRGAWGEFASVGLGKTTIALSAFWLLQKASLVDGILVLGPESARHSWTGRNADSAKFGLPSHLVSSSKKPLPTEGVVFCSYDKAWRPAYVGQLLQRLKGGRWILCLDEAHQASYTSKRWKPIEFWAQLCHWRWALTATPLSNYPDKIWALWRFLTLSSCTLTQWVTWFRKNEDEWHEGRLRDLGEYLKVCTVTRTRAEVAPHLPKTIVREISVEMTGQQRVAYNELVQTDKTTGPDGKQLRAMDWMGRLVHLQSVACHHQLPFEGALSDEVAKLEALREVLDQLAGEKVVIWSWRPRVLQWLLSVLGEQGVLYIGETSKRAREGAILRFNTDPKCRLFLGNPSAAGAGLNLPCANFCIFWESDWSAVEVEQAMGRVERGVDYPQKHQIRLISTATVEENIWEAVAKKQNLKAMILGGKVSMENLWKTGIKERWMKHAPR